MSKAPKIILVDLHLALRNVLRQRRRSYIALLAICFGVVAMMLASGFIAWILQETREDAIANQYGHIQVSQPGYHENGQSDPFAYLLPQHSPALTLLQKTRGVRSVVPRLEFTGLVSHGDTTLTFLGEGVNPARDPALKNLHIVKGSNFTAGTENGILMGIGLADNLGVKTGDKVVLLVNTASGGINAIEGPITGLTFTSMKAIDDTTLRIPINMARKLLRVSGSHVWVATLQRTELTDKVINQLKHAPAMQRFEIVGWSQLADFYNKTVELFSRQIGIVKLIIAIIIVLSISNTMTMNVMERTAEIGTAMALGIRRLRILALFLMEGLLLGVLGGTIGIVVGYLLAKFASAVGIPMPPAPGMTEGFDAAIILTPQIILEAAALAMLTTLSASIYPAWRASRLVIVDALRHNR
jgi:putative ABC transport system permease protein